MSDLLDQPQQPTFLDFDIGSSTTICTPSYSLVPRQKEITLNAEVLSPSGRFSWTYRTKHMTIDLGKRWQTSSPAYGLNDKIEGSVRIGSKHPELIEGVSISLEGNLMTSVLGDGGVSKSNTLFLSHTVSLPLSSHLAQGDEYPFLIPIPVEITLQGITHLTPPSFYRLEAGLTGEVSYTLRISMTRQGMRMPFKIENDETKIIPILYFPKTRPTDPPLANIPKPLSERDLHFASPDVLISDHINTIPLVPYWSPIFSHKRSSEGLETFRKSVFFSLPAPQSFGSGERTPFFVSLVFNHSPVQAAMYAKHIRVVLMKQLTIRPIKSNLRKLFTRSKTSPQSPASSPKNLKFLSPSHSRSGSPEISDKEGDDARAHTFISSGCSSPSVDMDMYGPPVKRRWHLTTGHLETLSEYSEGVYLLRGWIPAGFLGQGCSWQIGQLARLQYFLQVDIDPPEFMEEHLPAFRLEKEVEITTDCWEAMDRELQSTGGVPTPALGLAQSLLDKELNSYDIL